MNTRRIILIVIALLVVFGIGNFIVGTTQTRSQLALIASKDAKDQEAAVERLHDRGVLFDALQGGAPIDTRLNAIAALQRLAADGKHKPYFDELLQMLKDPDTESVDAKTHPVRDAATDAVAKVGMQYPEVLMDAAKDPDGSIKGQSQAAIKKIGKPMEKDLASRLGDSALRGPFGDILSGYGPETIPLIAPYLQPPLLKTDAKPDDLASTEIELIGIMGKFSVPEAATPIMPFADAGDPNVRRAVITALANIGQPIGAPVLIKALNDVGTDPSARAAAAAALGAIESPAANAAMETALSDYDLSVADAAAGGLKRAGDSAQSAIAQALATPSKAVRARAATAAGGLSSPDLATKAIADPDPTVRANGVQSLGDILFRDRTVQVDLTALATATAPKDQAAAFDALQKQGAVPYLLAAGAPPSARPNAVAVLTAQSAAEKDDVKRKSLDDLRAKLTAGVVSGTALSVNPITATSVAPLVTALSDKDGAVAQSAGIALGRLGDVAAPSLIAALGSGDETIAYRASQALTTIGKSVVPALVDAAQIANPTARWSAITLGQIGDPRAVPALEALKRSPDADTANDAGTALSKVRPG